MYIVEQHQMKGSLLLALYVFLACKIPSFMFCFLVFLDEGESHSFCTKLLSYQRFSLGILHQSPRHECLIKYFYNPLFGSYSINGRSVSRTTFHEIRITWRSLASRQVANFWGDTLTACLRETLWSVDFNPFLLHFIRDVCDICDDWNAWGYRCSSFSVLWGALHGNHSILINTCSDTSTVKPCLGWDGLLAVYTKLFDKMLEFN